MQTLPTLRTKPSVTAAKHLGVWLSVTHTHPARVSLQNSSLSSVAAEVTTLLSIVVAVSGRKERRLLQSKRKECAAEVMGLHAPASAQINPSYAFYRTGDTLSEAATSSRLRVRPTLHPLQPTHEDGPSGRLPHRVVNVSRLVLMCRWWNHNHSVPNRLTLQLPPQIQSLISCRTFLLRPS
jgi:hypothetical protein